jgi:hypothetical protein
MEYLASRLQLIPAAENLPGSSSPGARLPDFGSKESKNPSLALEPHEPWPYQGNSPLCQASPGNAPTHFQLLNSDFGRPLRQD